MLKGDEMKKIIYCCDNCDAKAEDYLPANWFILGFAQVKSIEMPDIKLRRPLMKFPYDWQETHHFCSEECMNEAVKVLGKCHQGQ